MASFALYRTVLAFHVVAIISWMAGILYLFRLFVYHAAEREAVVKERFKVMERKLYKIIVVPAMLLAFALGIALIAMNPGLLHQPWLHAKLALVVALAGFSGFGGKLRRELERDVCRYSERTFRILNEVPTVLMVLIVLLVIVRPF